MRRRALERALKRERIQNKQLRLRLRWAEQARQRFVELAISILRGGSF